jgi:Fe2+ or Zn2+ uptake regulation protein
MPVAPPPLGVDDWRAALCDAGLRVTTPRLTVLSVVHDLPHSPADTVLAAVRERVGTLSTQAVYDVLHALTSAGLLRRIEPAGAPMLYETRVGDNHHHLVCRQCARVVDVPCETDVVPCARPADEHGFDLDEAEIMFWGFCPDCRRATPDKAGPDRAAPDRAAPDRAAPDRAGRPPAASNSPRKDAP